MESEKLNHSSKKEYEKPRIKIRIPFETYTGTTAAPPTGLVTGPCGCVDTDGDGKAECCEDD